MTTNTVFDEYKHLHQQRQEWFQNLKKGYGQIGANIIMEQSWTAAILGDEWEKHFSWSDHPADQKGISEIKFILPVLKQILDMESEYRRNENKNIQAELLKLRHEEDKMGASFLANKGCIRFGVRIDFENYPPLLFSRTEFQQISSYFESIFPTLEVREKKDIFRPPLVIWKMHDQKMYNFLSKWKHEIVNQDCGYSDQFEILIICYFDTCELTSENVLETLEIADQTACGKVVKICESFLIENGKDFAVEKLKEVASRYNLTVLLEKME